MYLFSDACPTDWLSDGRDDTWHTIANFTFQSDPTKQSLVEAGSPHFEILASDQLYGDLIQQWESGLENQVLVLLFMAWFVADQFIFHSSRLKA